MHGIACMASSKAEVGMCWGLSQAAGQASAQNFSVLCQVGSMSADNGRTFALLSLMSSHWTLNLKVPFPV